MQMKSVRGIPEIEIQYSRSITNAVLWLATLFSIYSVIDSERALVNKMTAASWRFRSVFEEDLDEVLNY